MLYFLGTAIAYFIDISIHSLLKIFYHTTCTYKVQLMFFLNYVLFLVQLLVPPLLQIVVPARYNLYFSYHLDFCTFLVQLVVLC